MTLPPARQRLRDLMFATLADERAHHDWHYRAVRPMPVPSSWRPFQTVIGDCSKGVQYMCHWANAPDPMGNGYGPYGNSQTIWLHLQRLPHRSDLDVGDIVTFGSWGEDHAAMVLEKGTDPLVWGFGHEGAPSTSRLSWDSRPQQFLRLPVVYVPTAQDKLRAQTTWFAWVAWKLGEGEWRHYGPANKTVRPNVPARIPATWWTRYAQFLANRKSGNDARA